jgi:hypothetical protein
VWRTKIFGAKTKKFLFSISFNCAQGRRGLYCDIKNISRCNTCGSLGAEAKDNDNHNEWNITDKQMPQGKQMKH